MAIFKYITISIIKIRMSINIYKMVTEPSSLFDLESSFSARYLATNLETAALRPKSIIKMLITELAIVYKA